MGKMGMVVVFAMTLAAMLLGYVLNRTRVASVENMSGYYKYSTARNIAHAGVAVALHELDNGNDSTALFKGSVMDGTYDVGIIFAGDTLDMTSRGIFMDTSYTVQLRLQRYPKAFPDVQGAVTMPAGGAVFRMKGNAVVDGNDHSEDGNPAPNPENKAGVVTMGELDSAVVAVYQSMIIGSPKVTTASKMPDPAEYVDEYAANADYTFNAGTYGSNSAWGSADEPVIVYCDAGSGTVEFTGTIDGWGILVVKGNLSITGDFNFRGLVLVYQDGSINNQVSMGAGSARVIGGIVMTGGSPGEFTLKGNAKVLYSSSALDKVEHMKKLMAYRILSWYE